MVFMLTVAAIYGIIALGVYFAGNWFTKKPYDDFDMMAAFAGLWICLPFIIVCRCLGYVLWFFGEAMGRLKDKMLEYKTRKQKKSVATKECSKDII